MIKIFCDLCGEEVKGSDHIEFDVYKIKPTQICLNCAKTFERQGKSALVGIDPVMADRVMRIIKCTNCKVALSSTWRLSDEGIRRVEKHIPLYGKTPPSKSGFRGAEVQAFLMTHPEITRYAILDDDSDFEPTQPLFKTTWQEGLTEEIMLAVIEHLNHEE